MADYRKTQSFYIAENYPYTPSGSQVDLENWEKEVAPGGVFNQDAKHPEIHYPLKIPLSINRFRSLDGNEWILTKQRWVGVNGFGDPQHRNISNLEYYDKPEFIHERVEDKNNPRNIVTKATDIREINRIYTLPFSPEALDQIYNDTPIADKRRLTFSVKDEAAAGIVRDIKKYEDLRNKSFDELYNVPPIVTAATAEQQQQIKRR